VKVKQYVFTETPEVRSPKKGEWCMVEDETFVQPRSDWASSRPIFTREVREVEVPDPVPAWKELLDDACKEILKVARQLSNKEAAYMKTQYRADGMRYAVQILKEKVHEGGRRLEGKA